MDGAVSLGDFVSCYPFPAFVLDAKPVSGNYGISLKPLVTNLPFRQVFVGPNSSPEVSSGLEWLQNLSSVQKTQELALWLTPLTETATKAAFEIELSPSWASNEYLPIRLQLIKTVCQGSLAIVTLPLSELPPVLPPSPKTLASETKTRSLKRPASANLRLRDFPPPNVMISSASTPPSSIQSVTPASEAEGHTAQHFVPQPNFEPIASRYDEIHRMMVEYPWETTSLGARDSWPDYLKSIIGIMLENPYPAAIWTIHFVGFGQELNIFYNGAYATMAGTKHPHLFGKAGVLAWGELWAHIGPHVQTVLDGKAVAKQDDLLFFGRLTEKMLPEETYHTWSWLPIYAPDGKAVGLYNTTFDTTSKVLAARQLKVLRQICERAMLAPNIEMFGHTLLEVFSDVQYEAPFAALYKCTATGNSEKSRSATDLTGSSSGSSDHSMMNFRVNFIGGLGIPEQPEGASHPMFPRSFHTKMVIGTARYSSDQGLSSPTVSNRSDSFSEPPSSQSTPSTGSETQTVLGDRPTRQALPAFDWSQPIAHAMKAGYAIHTPTLPPALMNDVGVGRGWKEHVRDAVVIPITAEGDTADAAVLILGINSRRPYDDQYASWIDVMRMTLGSALNAVLGREAETRRADQLAQLDSAKTAFFSNASHELRTPLTLIAGPLAEALNRSEDRVVKDRLSLASRNVARLSRLVDSLMDFSRIEGGKLTGRFRPVSLSPFTEDLASLFRSTIEKNGIEYNVDCRSNDKSIVYVDSELWEKVVFNLIGNAFKYTLEGTITVKMRISPLWATFSVIDTGVGIPAEDIDRIFDRFHRVAATSRSHEGTGIGLALTKELVRLHGGNLTVTSTPQRDGDDEYHGSTFTVTIPVGHAHIPKVHIDEGSPSTNPLRSYARGIIDEAAQWGRGPTLDATTPSDTSEEGGGSLSSGDSGTVFFKRTDVVLVVDDNSDMRRYIRSIFAHYCTAAEACNGQEALDMMLSGKVKPDVVVTDRMMPVMDGDTLLQAMKIHPELRRTPVIMVTADAGDEARLDGLLAGADDYISKPFTSKQLVARTHLQMQMGKRKAELESRFEASTHQLRVLSELAPVGIFRADTTGHITWANPTWHELTQHDSGASLDDWLEYIVPADRQVVQEAWHRLYEDLDPPRLVMEFNFTSGRCVQAQFNVLDSQILGAPSILGTLTDISERRMLQEAQLAHAEEREAVARHKAEDSEIRRQEAEERRRAQELLIDVTSHELRQPVSAILNCASLVRANYRTLRETLVGHSQKKTPFTPTADLFVQMEEDLEALEAIYQCGLSQERIANDVLSLSRMQLEVLSILPVDFVLSEEMRRICSVFHNELRMKSIDFTLTLGASIERSGISQICLDKSRFAQIVTNLLSNAIKFTDISPASHRKIEVVLDVSIQPPEPDTCIPPANQSHNPSPGDDGIFVYVSVKDSGPGLKPADLALLFQRFAQGSNSHEVFGGSGLGLFVSRKLCELMGGRIEVDSQYGQGATFRFFVRGTQPKGTDSASSTEISVGHAPVDASSDKPARPMRVLITEDNQINQTILNRQLKKSGCQTTLANNGVEALDAIKKFHEDNHEMFDVILMDCEMPVMNGYTAAREIRKMEAKGIFSSRNYIIALTGNARSAQVQSALDAGMDEVMIKVCILCLYAPYNIDELLRTMQQKVANRPAVLPTPQRASPLPAPTPASESFLLPTSAPVPVPGAISLPQTPLALSALVGPTPTLRTDTGDGEAHADEVETNGDGDVEPTLDVETPTPPLRGREPQLQ